MVHFVLGLYVALFLVTLMSLALFGTSSLLTNLLYNANIREGLKGAMNYLSQNMRTFLAVFAGCFVGELVVISKCWDYVDIFQLIHLMNGKTSELNPIFTSVCLSSTPLPILIVVIVYTAVERTSSYFNET